MIPAEIGEGDLCLERGEFDRRRMERRRNWGFSVTGPVAEL